MFPIDDNESTSEADNFIKRTKHCLKFGAFNNNELNKYLILNYIDTTMRLELQETYEYLIDSAKTANERNNVEYRHDGGIEGIEIEFDNLNSDRYVVFVYFGENYHLKVCKDFNIGIKTKKVSIESAGVVQNKKIHSKKRLNFKVRYNNPFAKTNRVHKSKLNEINRQNAMEKARVRSKSPLTPLTASQNGGYETIIDGDGDFTLVQGMRY